MPNEIVSSNTYPIDGGGEKRRAVSSLHFSPPDGRSTRYERQDFVALACRAQRTVQVRLRAPSGSRPARTDGPLTHFASPRGEKCRLARVKSHAGGVTRPWTDCVLPSRFRKAAPRSARNRAGVARNPLGDGHLQLVGFVVRRRRSPGSPSSSLRAEDEQEPAAPPTGLLTRAAMRQQIESAGRASR